LLYACYRNSLVLAARNQVETIAFPCISTGVYGYPFDEACKVALRTIGDFLREDTSVSEVLLCCFSNADFSRYQEIYDRSENE